MPLLKCKNRSEQLLSRSIKEYLDIYPIMRKKEAEQAMRAEAARLGLELLDTVEFQSIGR